MVTTKLLVISGSSRQNTFFDICLSTSPKRRPFLLRIPMFTGHQPHWVTEFLQLLGLAGQWGIGQVHFEVAHTWHEGTPWCRTRGVYRKLIIKQQSCKNTTKKYNSWNFSSHYQWMEYLSIMIYPSIHPSIHPSINVHIHVHIYIYINIGMYVCM